MSTIKVHNVETNEIIEREMTIQEKAQYEAECEATKKLDAENALKAQQKNVLLEKLGITEEEAKLLLA